DRGKFDALSPGYGSGDQPDRAQNRDRFHSTMERSPISTPVRMQKPRHDHCLLHRCRSPSKIVLGSNLGDPRAPRRRTTRAILCRVSMVLVVNAARQNVRRMVACKRRGTFFWVVTAPKAV